MGTSQDDETATSQFRRRFVAKTSQFRRRFVVMLRRSDVEMLYPYNVAGR